MSQITETSSVLAAPTANVLPQTQTLAVNPGQTLVTTPSLADALAEVENLAAFCAALRAAIVNNSTYAALQTAVSALPANP